MSPDSFFKPGIILRSFFDSVYEALKLSLCSGMMRDEKRNYSLLCQIFSVVRRLIKFSDGSSLLLKD